MMKRRSECKKMKEYMAKSRIGVVLSGFCVYDKPDADLGLHISELLSYR